MEGGKHIKASKAAYGASQSEEAPYARINIFYKEQRKDAPRPRISVLKAHPSLLLL
jgi:hypothetical protein